MDEQFQIRSVSFDTSFLLKDESSIDLVIKAVARDHIPCFVTATVASELEQLKIWGRITESTYEKARKRWMHVHATIIDFKNRLLSDALGNACLRSMQNHGIDAKHVINDCTILVSNLKNGVDLFLSEDFHFTSSITTEVINEVQSVACSEYFLMCDSQLYSIDAKTFLKIYSNGSIDLKAVQSYMHQGQKKQFTTPKGKEGGETKHAPARQTDATQTRETSVTGRQERRSGR